MSRPPAALAWLAVGLISASALAAQVPQGTPSPPPIPETAESAAAEAAALEQGPIVRAIEIRSETAIPQDVLEEDVLPLLELQVGAPLTQERASRTLRNLQATGIASEIELYTRAAADPANPAAPAAPADNGVVAVLVLRPVVLVEAVRITGELGGLRDSDLRREIQQGEAEPLSEDNVLKGVRSLEAYYQAQGYFGAQVRVQVATNEATRRATVTYNIRSGPRAQVAAVEFQGPIAPFTPAQLIERLQDRPGKAYDQRAVREDAERLQSWLLDQGYRAADVGTPTEQIGGTDQSVTITYPIEVGPRVNVTVVGADLEELRRKNLLPFLGEQGFDEALVTQAVQRIKRYYQEKGYYRVEVEPRIEEAQIESDNELRVALTVQPGPVYTLAAVDFTGNATFDDGRLRELMATAPRDLLGRFGLGSRGTLVRADLDADLENILAFYRWEGFPNAEVGPPKIAEQGQELHVEIPVHERLRQNVGSLDFQGFSALKPQSLELPLAAGGPFSPSRLDQTLAKLRQSYWDKGYAAAQVSARPVWNADQTRVDLTFEALEGTQVLLDRVIVRGNQRTDSDVIRRSIGLKPGDPVSETRVFEIERDLYRIGIFSSVDARLTWAGLETTTRDLIVRVREGRPRRVAYGLGIEYSSDDRFNPRGSFSFTHNNVAGRAFTLRTDLRYSRLEKSFRFLFGQPYLGSHAIATTYSLFYFDEEHDFGDVIREGVRLEAHRDYGDRRVGVAYDYRLVELTPTDDLFDIDRNDQDLKISSLVPSFFWDRRDDPLLATQGWSALAQLQYSFPFLQAEGEFVKLFLQQTQYLPLRGRKAGVPRGREQVIVASLRAGGIEPLAHLPPDLIFPEELQEQGLPSADVFIDERFFAGGSTTHRAYGRDDLGIRGETLILKPGKLETDPGAFYAAGGNGLLLLNLEYRFPVFGDIVGGTLFYDAGNVWPDWRDIDAREAKQGVGIGVRYNSPIGPLRVDVGWKLHPEPGEDRYQFNLTFGNPF